MAVIAHNMVTSKVNDTGVTGTVVVTILLAVIVKVLVPRSANEILLSSIMILEKSEDKLM